MYALKISCILSKGGEGVYGNGQKITSVAQIKSWSIVFDTEYISNQKIVQINAFELLLKLV